MGVVYHANYLVWCEVGRTELIRELGASYADLERQGLFLAVSEVSMRFHASARYDDRIVVETVVDEVRSRVLKLRYSIARIDDDETLQRLVSAHTALVALDPEGRPRTLPPELLSIMRSAAHAA